MHQSSEYMGLKCYSNQVAKCFLTNLKFEIFNLSQNKPYNASTKINFEESYFKNPKTRHCEDSRNLGCDVFVLSKIAILEGVFGFGSKGNVSSQHFFCCQREKSPPKNLIIEKFKT